MAMVDPRLEFLPEHDGPAFKAWHLIMQTTMGKVVEPTGFRPDTGQSVNTPHLKTDLHNKSFKAPGDFLSLTQCDDNLYTTESTSFLNDTNDTKNDEENTNFAPWNKNNKNYPENAYGLHLEIIDFHDYMSPSPEEEFMRDNVVQRITKLITSIWSGAKVEVFGSFRTNLYLPSSDIDLVVFGKWESLPLYTLEKALVNHGIADASSIKVLDKASVPIVKLTDLMSKVCVDISFNTETAVQSADMVKSYIKKYRILPYLFLTLKHFLVQRDLNEVFTGGISSYCLMLLAVSFLQRHPRIDATSSKANLGVLLMEFFELYGRNFNYQKICIRLKDGGSYINKDSLSRGNEKGEIPALLCIEDPLTLTIDIGRSSYGILRVKEAFEYAYNVLDGALRNKCYFKVNHNSTYLSRIISVPTMLVAYRRWVHSVFYHHSPNLHVDVIKPMILD